MPSRPVISSAHAARTILYLFLSFTIFIITSPSCLVSATTVEVEAGGFNRISKAIESASAGDTLLLARGRYVEYKTVVVPKPLVFAVKDPVNGTGKVTISINAANNPDAFRLDSLDVSFDEIQLVDSRSFSTGNKPCDFAEPRPLGANYTVSFTQPTIKNNSLVVDADLGTWFNTRRITQMSFGTCKDNAEPGASILRRYIGIDTLTCHAVLHVQIPMQDLRRCGVAVEVNPVFQDYRASVGIVFEETISKRDDGTPLRITTSREGRMNTILRVRIDRGARVDTAVAANYKSSDMQGTLVVDQVEPITANEFQSQLQLQVTLPSPLVIPMGRSFPVTLSDMMAKDVLATNYTVSTPCTDLTPGQKCNQTLYFTVRGCDLTGRYVIRDLPLTCPPNLIGDPRCPRDPGNAGFAFYTVSTDFCRGVGGTLKGGFIPTVQLREKDDYTGDRANSEYKLGDQSFMAVTLLTKQKGVLLLDAFVSQVRRTSTGDCSGFDPNGSMNLIKGSGLRQNLIMTASPPEIRVPFSLDDILVCPSSPLGKVDLALNFTVVVDFAESTVSVDARRRRRHIFIVEFSGSEIESTASETIEKFGRFGYPEVDGGEISHMGELKMRRVAAAGDGRRSGVASRSLSVSYVKGGSVENSASNTNKTGTNSSDIAKSESAAQGDFLQTHKTIFIIAGAAGGGLCLLCCVCTCLLCIAVRRREARRKRMGKIPARMEMARIEDDRERLTRTITDDSFILDERGANGYGNVMDPNSFHYWRGSAFAIPAGGGGGGGGFSNGRRLSSGQLMTSTQSQMNFSSI